MSLDVDLHKAAELEQQFDSEMRFRPLTRIGDFVVGALLLGLSCFHFYTAGFGLLRDDIHRGIHMSLVLGVIFLVFAANPRRQRAPREALWTPGGVPLYDWVLFVAAAISSLYLP